MGAGIAQIAAVAGHLVKIFDAEPGLADKAIGNIAKNLGKLVDERGLVFAVVSSGFDESTTYVAPVKELTLAKIYRAEPPRGDGSRLNLLEYSDKY
jgi:3-hydroxybutyryl-CoA dehydrogenase